MSQEVDMLPSDGRYPHEQFQGLLVALCLVAVQYPGEQNGVVGRYSEAESLFKRALDINEKAFGSGDGHVAIDLNNMALLYEYEGKYSEAESLQCSASAFRVN
jgi:Tetratricopeptide repeat